MPFDNVEEQQDPTTLPSRMRRNLYPFAGGVPSIENKPSGLEPTPRGDATPKANHPCGQT